MPTKPSAETILQATREANPAMAVVQEDDCIGCTKCIQACPFDSILGAANVMHTILEQNCTGCGLCVEPCPVDCIDLRPLATFSFDSAHARARYEAREKRLQIELEQKKQTYKTKRQPEKQKKQAYIQAALARVKTKRSMA